MKTGSLLALSLAVSLATTAGAALAQQGQPNPKSGQMQSQMGEHDQSRMHDQDGRPMVGYHLMTPEERQQYRHRMNALDSAEDRQAFRDQHHQRMVDRARAQGLDPDTVSDLSGADEQRGDMSGRKGMGSEGQSVLNGSLGSDEDVGPDINSQRTGDGMPRANPPGGVHQ
ncbi:hypothetical protein [Marinobacter lipolyticus]|mgnify:CR=1 FL=1|uniref:hypothetical protein n=1 Tax=Marinobacter lipolyticus TaxID=209639 RepID=UPI001BCB96F3|nr:hypothetical protein [Marinobacter lipolyticus]